MSITQHVQCNKFILHLFIFFMINNYLFKSYSNKNINSTYILFSFVNTFIYLIINISDIKYITHTELIIQTIIYTFIIYITLNNKKLHK
jgi:hypothetical protein